MQLELEAIVREIQECIRDLCGESSAKAIEHFVPSSLAVFNPTCYETSLAELVPTLSKRIIKAVEAAVSRKAGIEIRQSERLFECMARISSNKGDVSPIISP
jgi:hypothetical protein